MYEIILYITYGIIYKLADELDDEEIYNIYFPNAKLIIYPILFLYNIYLFYFNDFNSNEFLLTFMLEMWYIFILFCRYFDDIFLYKIAEMKLTFQDPFTILSVILLPMFIYKFYDVLTNNLFIIVSSGLYAGFLGIIQDIDNSILGTYILNNKYNNNNKKYYKIIYRTFLLLILISCLYLTLSNFIYVINIFLIGYFCTSIISLFFQKYIEYSKSMVELHDLIQ